MSRTRYIQNDLFNNKTVHMMAHILEPQFEYLTIYTEI